MSYEHALVKELEKEHEENMKFVATAGQPPNSVMLNGVGVPASLHNLCGMLQKINPGIKFSAGAHIGFTRRVWVYFDGDEYARIRLGFDVYDVRHRGSNRYGVYARGIKNTKFRDDREHYYMALTDNVNVALKNARKYMRPYSTSEIADLSRSTFRHHVLEAPNKASTQHSKAREALNSHSQLLNEMQTIVNSGYSFNDLSFSKTVHEFLGTHADEKTKRSETHHGYYVRVRLLDGEQMFEVIPMYDIRRNTSATPLQQSTTYNLEALNTLDDTLAPKLAALTVLGDKAFVEGLGYKVSETSYWVLR